MDKLLFSLLIVALALLGQIQANTCQVPEEKSFNLFESEQIEPDLVDGQINFSKHWYYWNANLPQPSVNTLFRVKYQRVGTQPTYIFVPKSWGGFKGVSSFQLSITGERLGLEFFTDVYHPQNTAIVLDDKIEKEPIWIDIFFQQESVQLFYDGQFQNQIHVNEPQNNKLNIFSAYETNGIYYQVHDCVGRCKGLISGLEIYNDITIKQKNCLTQGKDSQVLEEDQGFLPF